MNPHPDHAAYAAQLPSDTELRDVLWSRIGQRGLPDLPECLGFTPEVKCAYKNCYKFVDSGVEVTLWLSEAQKIGMINVNRL